MPGAVQAAAPSAVLPQILAGSFEQVRDFYAEENNYADGSRQTGIFSAVSVRSWKVSEKLTAAQLLALVTFYNTMLGPTREFLMYDPSETLPVNSYDPEGDATDGAYIVRFSGAMTFANGLPRHLAQFGLVEVG